ncbi:MAG: TolC family protein [Nitrospirae bacterium]|nr:TolC family protein [Nitrospirota bacterium]
MTTKVTMAIRVIGHKTGIFLLITLILLFGTSPALSSVPDNKIGNIQVVQSYVYASVVINLASPSNYNTSELLDDKIIYLDIEGTIADNSAISNKYISDALLKKVYMCKANRHTVRVVLQLNNDSQYQYKVLTLTNPHRIAVNISADSFKTSDTKPSEGKIQALCHYDQETPPDAADIAAAPPPDTKEEPMQVTQVSEPLIEKETTPEPNPPAPVQEPALATANPQEAITQEYNGSKQTDQETIADAADIAAAPPPDTKEEPMQVTQVSEPPIEKETTPEPNPPAPVQEPALATATPPEAITQESRFMGNTNIDMQSSAVLTFRDYILMVLGNNSSMKANRQDYLKSMILFQRDIELYDFNVKLTGSAGYNQDTAYQILGGDLSNKGPQGTLALTVTKNLYDGGKKQILQKEYAVFKELTESGFLKKKDAIIVTAANYYAELYYRQESLKYMKEQYERQKVFMEKIDKWHQKEVKLSRYDLLTAKNEHLKLERELVEQKAAILKTETAFRQYGELYYEKPLVLVPLNINFSMDVETLQKYVAVHNKSVNEARLQVDIQKFKIAEKDAEGGLRVDSSVSVGMHHEKNAQGQSGNVPASAFLSFSLPIFDGGVKKSEVRAEQRELAKRQENLQQITKEIIQTIFEIYTDYRKLQSQLEILKQIDDSNEDRLKTAMERLDKGLGEYREVRESWSELITTKIELIRNTIITQQMLINLSVYSGFELPL